VRAWEDRREAKLLLEKVQKGTRKAAKPYRECQPVAAVKVRPSKKSGSSPIEANQRKK